MFKKLVVLLVSCFFCAVVTAQKVTLPKDGVWVEIFTAAEGGYMNPISADLKWHVAESNNMPTAFCVRGRPVDLKDPPYYTTGGHNTVWACNPNNKDIDISVNKTTGEFIP